MEVPFDNPLLNHNRSQYIPAISLQLWQNRPHISRIQIIFIIMKWSLCRYNQTFEKKIRGKSPIAQLQTSWDCPGTHKHQKPT